MLHLLKLVCSLDFIMFLLGNQRWFTNAYEDTLNSYT